jgi:hypothetical protein
MDIERREENGRVTSCDGGMGGGQRSANFPGCIHGLAALYILHDFASSLPPVNRLMIALSSPCDHSRFTLLPES